MGRTGIIGTPLLVVLLAGSLAGCVVIPVPRSGRAETTKWREKGRDLLASGTSRTDIEHKLGPPHLVFADLKVTGYTWSGGEWGFLWIAYMAAEYTKPVTHRVLWLQFDDENRLTRCEVRRRNKKQVHRDQAAAWVRSAPLPSPPSSAHPGTTSPP